MKGFEPKMYRISKGRIQAAAGVLAALLLAGCSSNQARDYGVNQSPVVSKGATLSAEVSEFLSSSAGESTRYFASTYWGDNVELTTDTAYYAASGRNCRRVLVSTMTGSDNGRWLACQQGDGEWVAVRPLR